MNSLIKPTALAIALAVAGGAIAQTTPTPAQQQELDAARASLDRAAQHYAELGRKYGAQGPIRIERRVLRKPVIGVLLAPDEGSGVRIAGVTPDSAAAAGGLKSGDRIVSIDGKAIAAGSGSARVDELRARLAALDAKTAIRVGYERDGKTQVVALTPKVGDRLLVLPGLDAIPGSAGEARIVETPRGRIDIEADRIDGALPRSERRVRIASPDGAPPAAWAMVAPDVHAEVIRLGGDCKDKDCKLPALAEAFRWNGLNLAAVDAQLGRYFGTSDGVLVLSTGKDLEGLQPGDVIRKIGGKPVNSPREAMEALRAQPADGKVAVDYLRDRVAGTAQVSMPKALPFSLPRIAMAPHAPGMPGAVEHRKLVFVGEDGKAQTRAAGDGKRMEKRKYVVIDQDGKRKEWEGGAGDTPPTWVQALPKDGKRIEKRVQVIVDDKGNQTVIEDDGAPLPPPPPRVD